MTEGTVQTTWPSEALLSLWAIVQITDYDDDGPLLRADDIGKMRAEILRVKAEMVTFYALAQATSDLMGNLYYDHITREVVAQDAYEHYSIVRERLAVAREAGYLDKED